MLTLVNGGWGISYDIALRWMPLDLTDDKSTLATRQPTITWAYVDPDLCRHMASLGHNELTYWLLRDVKLISYMCFWTHFMD